MGGMQVDSKLAYGVAILFLLGTLGAAWYLIGQLRAAARIDAAPVRVQGVVDDLIPAKGGMKAVISYEVAGRRFSNGSLSNALTPADREPGGIAIGDRVCLEAAADHPATVRVCGQRYPDGDVPSTVVLGMVAGTAGVFCALGFAVSGARAERDAAGRGPVAGAGGAGSADGFNRWTRPAP
jgi:hypothetical protein